MNHTVFGFSPAGGKLKAPRWTKGEAVYFLNLRNFTPKKKEAEVEKDIEKDEEIQTVIKELSAGSLQELIIASVSRQVTQ